MTLLNRKLNFRFIILPNRFIELGNDSDKIAKNKQFLKHIGDDIYIDQTVKVVDKMIGEEQLAQRNNYNF